MRLVKGLLWPLAAPQGVFLLLVLAYVEQPMPEDPAYASWTMWWSFVLILYHLPRKLRAYGIGGESVYDIHAETVDLELAKLSLDPQLLNSERDN